MRRKTHEAASESRVKTGWGAPVCPEKLSQVKSSQVKSRHVHVVQLVPGDDHEARGAEQGADGRAEGGPGGGATASAPITIKKRLRHTWPTIKHASRRS